jgi:hypothetical protein
MVVNQLECCGNNSSSLKKKIVASKKHTLTKSSFVVRSPFVVALLPTAPSRSPYIWLDKLRFHKGFLEKPREEI